MHELTRLALRAPRATLSLLLLLTLSLAAGALRVERAYGVDSLLGPGHPALAAQQRLIDTYGGGYPMLVAWQCGPGCACANAFDGASLAVASDLERRLGALGVVRRVLGPATAPLLVPDAAGFSARRFVDADGRVAEDAEELARRAVEDPFWQRQVVSADARVAAVTIVPVDRSSPAMERVVDEVLEVLGPYEARGFSFHLAGHPAESVINGRALADSTARATPACVAILAVAILGLLRCWRSALTALVTVGVAVLWSFGLLGWLGWPQEYALQVLAPLLLVVGVCDAVHLLARAAREDLLSAAEAVGPACAVTSATTAAAFLSFTLTPLLGFRRLGVVAGFGVLACLLLTFTLLPILARWLPPSLAAARPRVDAWGSVLAGAARSAAGAARPVLVTAALLFAAGSLGWARFLRVDTDFEALFGEDNPVVQGSRFVDANLRGQDSLEIELALPGSQVLLEPDTQLRLGRLERFLETRAGLGRATSVRELLSRANRLLHDDEPAWERPGASPAANAQLLELVEMGEPDALAAWVARDRRHLRVSAEGVSGPASSRAEVLARVRAFAAAELPASWRWVLSGPFAMEFQWADDLRSAQQRSFGAALLLVFALLAAYLRSLRLGLVGLVPALLSAVVTLGAMGFAGLLLDVGRSMVAAVVIGIAVDDAVHVLGCYQRERAGGRACAAALEAAFEQTGPAVVVTSAALAAGFLALSLSAWASIASFGLLVSASILVALGTTLWILPPLLLVLEEPPFRK